MEARWQILGLVVVAVIAGGIAIARPHWHRHHTTVTAQDQARLIGAIRAQNPNTVLVSSACGNVEGGPGCTVILRKGATCSDWVANLAADGAVLAPIGTGDHC